MARYVVGIVRIGTRFATCYSDAGFGSRARKIRGEVEVQQLVSQGTAIGGVSRGGGTCGNYLEGSSPIEGEFLFENFVVGVFPQPLADSGGGVIDPNPSTSRVLGAAE